MNWTRRPAAQIDATEAAGALRTAPRAVVVANFIYTYCPDTCPVLSVQMR